MYEWRCVQDMGWAGSTLHVGLGVLYARNLAQRAGDTGRSVGL